MNMKRVDVRNDLEQGTEELKIDVEEFEKSTIPAIKVGPFYNGSNLSMNQFPTIRKPSKEILETVKLRPTYVSFPPPEGGRSPLKTFLNTPRVGYSSIAYSPPLYPNSPDSLKEYFSSMENLSLFGASLTGINYFLGIGILGLPYTLKVAGWCGLISLFFIGFVMFYCAVLLGRCQYRLSLNSYPEIVDACFGYHGRNFVSILFYFNLLFDMSLFLALLSNSVNFVLSENRIRLSNTETTIMVTTIVTILSMTLANIKTVCFFSVLGTFSTLIMCSLVIVEFALQLSNFSEKNQENVDAPLHSHESKSFVTSIISGLGSQLKVLGIFSYCFMGHAVLPTILKNLKKPDSFHLVVTSIFGFAMIVFFLMAAIGYLTYGSEVNENLLDNFEASALTFTIVAFMIVGVTVKFILAAYPVCEGLLDIMFRYLNPQTNTETEYNVTGYQYKILTENVNGTRQKSFRLVSIAINLLIP